MKTHLADWLLRGPEPCEYAALSDCVETVATLVTNGELAEAAVRQLWHQITHQYLPDTVQAKVVFTPNGYHGCFEVIDWIYVRRMSSDPTQKRWDEYFHAQVAPRAVRNRKQFFIDLLSAISPRIERLQGPEALRVLNIASGPCRDVSEWYAGNGNRHVRIACVERDPRAINYGRALCAGWEDRVEFRQADGLRLRLPSDARADLVWCAGMFDYLSDETFVRGARRLAANCRSGGMVVIGNFSPRNTTRPYMEFFGGWKLNHRSEDALRLLARQAGFPDEAVSVEAEPLGVNLFLCLRK